MVFMSLITRSFFRLSLPFVCALASAILMAPTAQALTYSILHSFVGAEGSESYTRLVQDAQGNLYGANHQYGAHGDLYGGGTVFKLDTNGNLTVLYSFCSLANCTDGSMPSGNIAVDATGNVYGVTAYGGSECSVSPQCGTIFKVDALGHESVLHNFPATSIDGVLPLSVVLDGNGTLWGITQQGGSFCNSVYPDNYRYGCGTLFKVNAPYAASDYLNYDSLYRSGVNGGYQFYGGVSFDTLGNLYGSALFGGSYSSGTIFEVAGVLQGTPRLVDLINFHGKADGKFPLGNLAVDGKGALYGTTASGGTHNRGTVFKYDPNSGIETVLYNFSGKHGTIPNGELVLDAQGNLYGTTVEGGANNLGTVFMVSPQGKETVLHSFQRNGKDGFSPGTGLTRGGKGNLYGTTRHGGLFGLGTVFQLSAVLETTTTLASSPNPSTRGKSVTFTATITSGSGIPPDDENVSFNKGDTFLGTGSLKDGVATFSTSTLGVGTATVRAIYAGDGAFKGSKSMAVKQVTK